MDLELKLLKDKVVEDEKSQGIGSLFNDEKGIHQHISSLKVKYQQMRLDMEKDRESLENDKWDVLGKQFVLDAEINILKDLNQWMQEISDDTQRTMN